ncbi:voltage-dependent potassium channel, beta subunit [Neoconidiobolus thromboides FSU 785]|nr:voltage-dependent potassium channel, beta subunit [Neoconidiobolus thromboides FSU 785]
MEYRYLGNSGLKVSVLSLGSWLTYGDQVDSEITLECMKTAFELGITHFDTAEVYANGQSEIEIGNIIQKLCWRRSEFTISTKLFWGGRGPNERGLSRKHILEGLEASLERLQLDYVDIVLAHRPDPDTPMEETVRAFTHLINQGKAMYWGTSEWNVSQIQEAVMISKTLNLIAPITEQPQYNMFHRERVEKEYNGLYEKFKLGLMVWSPLGSGILTGKYNEYVPENSRLNLKNNLVTKRMRDWLDTDEGRLKLLKVRELERISKKLHCTNSQLALAWCLHNSQVGTVLTGATCKEQIIENVKCLSILNKLSPEILNDIDNILKNKPALELNFRNT